MACSKLLAGCAIALPSIAMAQAGTASALSEPLEPVCCKAHMLQGRLDAGLDPTGEPPPAFTPREAMTDSDVLHNFLEIELVPSAADPAPNIIGTNTITARSTIAGLTEFTFMLRSNFSIPQVLFNGVTPLTVSSVGTYGRRVTLPRALALNEQFTLRIEYSGRAVSRGFGSIEFVTFGGQPAIFTLSEPYYAGTWWPAKDGDFGAPGDNADKATFDIHVTVPTAMSVASNGLLQGIDALSGGRRKHRWHTNYPMASYLASIGAATYNSWTSNYAYPLQGGGTGNMPVQFFISPPSDTPGNRAAAEVCIPQMATFRTVFGEYPFVNEKYGIYHFTFGGGMEHQTMTGQGSFGESLTAHELAHQWWGDNVTARTWGDIWLNEGFATYSQALWEERKPGGSFGALQGFMGGNRPRTDSGSVFRYDVSSAGAIFSGEFAYDKGAWVLHHLRKSLGDATFFSMLATYRAAFEGTAATTDDLASIVTAVSGRDYAPFFEAWVMGEGAPNFAVGSQRVVINALPYLKLRVRQSQNGALPVFPSALDVRAATTGGTATYLVRNDERTEHFVIPLTTSGNLSTVTIDPDIWVLNGAKTSEAFVAGPPVVLMTTPLPAQTFGVGAGPASAELTFSENVATSADAFTLLRAGSPVPFTYAYNIATQRVTLTLAEALSGGSYSLVASAPGITANAGLALDGEPVALPSGDGLAGGNFTLTFSVAFCPADFNQDGSTDFFDYDDFVACFEGSCAPGASADFNHDGSIDFFDYDDFVAAFESAC